MFDKKQYRWIITKTSNESNKTKISHVPYPNAKIQCILQLSLMKT
jgi:hypothetical protein